MSSSPSSSMLPATARQAERTTLISAVVNLLLSTAQVVIGLFAHSQALIADGIHSLSDLVADGVILVVNRRSHAAPDADHAYGHRRYENAASLFLGVLLLAVGAGMLWAGATRIQNPALIPTAHVSALYAALAALAVKEGLFRYMLASARRLGSSMLVANAWHARSDAASSLVVAAGIIGNLTGYPILDPLAAMVVGVMVGRMGWTFGWNALNDLMDRALPAAEVAKLQATLAATSGVLSVHDLRTRRMGDYSILDAHLEVAPRISVSEGHYIAARARDRVLAAHDSLFVQIHIDPAETIPTDAGALPMRDEILPLIAHAAPELLDRPYTVALHYLEGRLAIDISLSSDAPFEGLPAIRAALAQHTQAPVEVTLYRCMRAD